VHCGGNLEQRPIRPKALLEINPAATKRVLRDHCP
jgi:hypothetical protein